MTIVRRARVADAAQIQGLIAQLGYAADVPHVQRRLASIEAAATDAVLVAESDGMVVGVASLHAFDLFHQPGRIGRITSFVVDADARRAGVGSALIDAADEFFRSVGCMRAEVTSGDHRPAAHAFYEAQGYVPDERRFLKRF